MGTLSAQRATALADRELLGSNADGDFSKAADEAERLPGFWLVDKLPYVPLAFLGLGLYRAWIELVFVGSFTSFAFDGSLIHNVYDTSMIAVLFGCAAAHRFIEPLYARRRFYLLTCLCMTAGGACAFAGMGFPDSGRALGIAAAIVGGAGTAGIILIWSELYSCLPPARVGLYYCASIIAAAFILYFCKGLSAPWLAGTAILLPFGSLAFAMLGFIGLPRLERPHASAAHFSFPWKPVLIMAVYAFAWGMRETSQYATGFGPHSAPGTMAVAVLLFVLIWRKGEHLEFNTFYRIALPLMMGAFLVIPAFGSLNAQVSNFCAMASYTAFSVLIMLILAHLSYRYSISAVWLFGIERGVRALFSIAGRMTAESFALLAAPPIASLIIGSATVALVVIGTMLFVSEKDFAGRWGVSFRSAGDTPSEAARLRRGDIDRRCSEMADRFGLSPRETDVLKLLARKRTVGQIQNDLMLSKDTVKTHVKHIYRKMNVHSRPELFDLLGIVED